MGEIVNFPPMKPDVKVGEGVPKEPTRMVASGNGPAMQQSNGFAVPISNIPVIIDLSNGGTVPGGQVYKTFATLEEANDYAQMVLKIIGFIVLSSYARPREGKDAEYIDGGRMQALLVEHMLKMGDA